MQLNLFEPLQYLQADKRVASLHQRMHLLNLIALELHHTDAAVPQHRLSIASILQDLFHMPNIGEGDQNLIHLELCAQDFPQPGQKWLLILFSFARLEPCQGYQAKLPALQ